MVQVRPEELPYLKEMLGHSRQAVVACLQVCRVRSDFEKPLSSAVYAFNCRACLQHTADQFELRDCLCALSENRHA